MNVVLVREYNKLQFIPIFSSEAEIFLEIAQLWTINHLTDDDGGKRWQGSVQTIPRSPLHNKSDRRSIVCQVRTLQMSIKLDFTRYVDTKYLN